MFSHIHSHKIQQRTFLEVFTYCSIYLRLFNSAHDLHQKIRRSLLYKVTTIRLHLLYQAISSLDIYLAFCVPCPLLATACFAAEVCPTTLCYLLATACFASVLLLRSVCVSYLFVYSFSKLFRKLFFQNATIPTFIIPFFYITHISSFGGPTFGLCSGWRYGDFLAIR